MSTTTESTQHTDDQTTARSSKGWRVVDIVVAAVLGVAIGLVFWAWNTIGGAWFGVMDALTPGLGGLAVGVWLLGGVVGGLVIRKPGAALLVELIAAAISAALGNQWGITTLYSGLALPPGPGQPRQVVAVQQHLPGLPGHLRRDPGRPARLDAGQGAGQHRRPGPVRRRPRGTACLTWALTATDASR